MTRQAWIDKDATATVALPRQCVRLRNPINNFKPTRLLHVRPGGHNCDLAG